MYSLFLYVVRWDEIPDALRALDWPSFFCRLTRRMRKKTFTQNVFIPLVVYPFRLFIQDAYYGLSPPDGTFE